MKKLLLTFFACIILALFSIYFIIPSSLHASVQVSVSASAAVINRYVMNDTAWKKWWPGKVENDFFVTDKGVRLQIVEKSYNNLTIHIFGTAGNWNSTLMLLPIKNDSVLLNWTYALQGSMNPLKRVSQYFASKRIFHQLHTILTKAKTSLENPDFVYGIPILYERVTDTLFITSKFSSLHYPSMADVYTKIGQLESLLNSQAIKPTNPPMLNIQKTDSALYKAMVAIPIKQLPHTNEGSVVKRMIMGNILTTRVHGGPAAIQNAYDQLQQYIYDYQMTQPAIPFESLITDRIRVSDTSQWVTKIVFPVY